MSICDILIWIFNLIDCYWDNDGGFLVFCVVKCIKCFMGIFLKNENEFDLKKYWFMVFRYGFWLFCFIVFVWNIVEVVFIFEDK